LIKIKHVKYGFMKKMDPAQPYELGFTTLAYIKI
jgi:hypothetical protein